MADDEVIRKKLLFDGDGTGDDRRINQFVKNFIKYIDLPDDDETNENNMLFDKMQSQLAQCETSYKKNLLMHEMMKAELEDFHKENEDTKHRTEALKTSIDKAKGNLNEAELLRKNKTEYNNLVKIIKEHPDRKQTQHEVTQLTKDLQELVKKDNALKKVLIKAEKHLHLLISSAYHSTDLIKKGIRNDDALDAPLETSDLEILSQETDDLPIDIPLDIENFDDSSSEADILISQEKDSLMDNISSEIDISEIGEKEEFLANENGDSISETDIKMDLSK